jgi:hypothetical protein
MKRKQILSSLRPVMGVLLIVTMSVLMQSCFSDDFDKTMKFETLPIIPGIPEDGSPVPGNSGIITTGARSTTEIQLVWTRANDAQTPQAELQYRVYRSSNNNISTPTLAEANGTVVLDWTPDIVTAVSDSLSPGTGYCFNIVVRDGDGNSAAYITVSVTTLTDAIYMFPAGLYAGNLSEATAISKVAKVAVAVSVRDNIDALCDAAKSSTYASLPCLNVRAFISVSSSDDIAGMPANFSVPTGRRIVGPGGTQIVDSWASLLDGTIDTSLGDAAAVSDHWWSGSLSDGTYDADNNCGGWTSVSEKGRSGLYNKTDANWIEGNTPNCDASRYVLCVCW